MQEDDEKFIRAAIQIARNARNKGNGPFVTDRSCETLAANHFRFIQSAFFR